MKFLIVGATGAIGGAILQQALRHPSITSVIALTRRPLDSTTNTTANPKLQNTIIPDFGALETVPDTTWRQILDADALVWAMGTYNLNEDVNLRYPLAFQEEFARRRAHTSSSSWEPRKQTTFRFILLSGAFVETDQSRRLWFLWDQRRMKGVLQTKTLEFAKQRKEEGWEAVIVRPGGVLFGGGMVNRVADFLFGKGMVIRGEELGGCVVDLVASGPGHAVVENREMVERGRKLLSESL